MRAKQVVRAVLDRLPDDCSLDQIIDRLCELERFPQESDEELVLTEEQQAELARRLERVDQEESRLIPWADLRRELERDD